MHIRCGLPTPAAGHWKMDLLNDVGEKVENFLDQTFGLTTGSYIKKYGPFLCRSIVILIYYFIGISYYHRVEGWTQVDCAYFITVSITTVGYGFFHPTTDPSRIFTCFYMLFGIFLVFDFISNAAKSCFMLALNKFIDNFSPSNTVHMKSVKRVGLSVSLLLFSVAFGTMFFALNEPWTFDMAFYWVITTMTTIGYGDLNVTKKSSKQFSIFFILLVVSIYITTVHSVIEAYSDSSTELAREKIVSTSFNEIELQRSESGKDLSSVDENEFVIRTLIKIGKLDHDRDIAPVIEKFEAAKRRSLSTRQTSL